MGLKKPTQQLQREIKQTATVLKSSGLERMQIAVRHSEAGLEAELLELLELLKVSANVQDAEGKLAGECQDEVIDPA